MDRTVPLIKRSAAEAIAAFTLVFAGCGAVISNAKCHGALGAAGSASSPRREWCRVSGDYPVVAGEERVPGGSPNGSESVLDRSPY